MPSVISFTSVRSLAWSVNHRIADGVAERRAQFVGDALGDGAGGKATRLSVPDGAADSAAQLQADLWQLGGLARPGLTGDDDHLIVVDGLGELVPPVADRQLRVGDCRDGSLAGGDQRLGRCELLGDLLDLLGADLPAQILDATAEPGGIADCQPVEAVSQLGD